MTSITIKKTTDGDFGGFTCHGHAGFAAAGADIVCAAISVLTINTVNSLEMLTGCPMKVDKDGSEGLISVVFTEGLCDRSRLLMESYVLGLSEIFNNYGKKHLKLEFADA